MDGIQEHARNASLKDCIAYHKGGTLAIRANGTRWPWLNVWSVYVLEWVAPENTPVSLTPQDAMTRMLGGSQEHAHVMVSGFASGSLEEARPPWQPEACNSGGIMTCLRRTGVAPC